jgi:cell division protein FtsL
MRMRNGRVTLLLLLSIVSAAVAVFSSGYEVTSQTPAKNINANR